MTRAGKRPREYTARAAASRLGVRTPRLRELHRQGKLPARFVRGRFLYSADEVDALRQWGPPQLSVNQVARLLGRCTKTIGHWTDLGVLTATVGNGARRRYSRHDIVRIVCALKGQRWISAAKLQEIARV